MPAGDPGREQFRDIITDFSNLHINVALNPLFLFRSEVAHNRELKTRNGIDTTTQMHFISHLQNCDKIRRRITYNPQDASLGDAVGQAIDDDAELEPGVEFDPEGVQRAPSLLMPFEWVVDGTDPNVPLLSQLDFRSEHGKTLIKAIDRAIVDWTRLESRNLGSYIYQMDSMRMYADYYEILEFLEFTGGDENLVDVTVGVRPTEEPRGPQASPNLVGETAAATT